MNLNSKYKVGEWFHCSQTNTVYELRYIREFAGTQQTAYFMYEGANKSYLFIKEQMNRFTRLNKSVAKVLYGCQQRGVR